MNDADIGHYQATIDVLSPLPGNGISVAICDAAQQCERHQATLGDFIELESHAYGQAKVTVSNFAENATAISYRITFLYRRKCK